MNQTAAPARPATVRRAMERALALARQGMGTAHPNPPVGAVVLRDGAIVGEGYHRRAGEPHAEAIALAHAADRARGATLVVTLEPCNHQGRTPPCVEAIAAAGIVRVHVGTSDPNSASGSGMEALRRRGIEVVSGPCPRIARYLIAGFASRVERGRPRIALKVAVSLDGRIASGSGDSRWISSEIARAWVHRRRREADAVVVGSETALRDNPSLTTRRPAGRSPDRIVIDSRLRVPASAQVWRADGAERIAATTVSAPEERVAALEAAGVTVWRLPADAEGRVDLRAWAARAGDAGYNTALVEGGGSLAGSLLAAQLVDVAWVAVSPRILLGGGGPGWTESLRVPSVARALRLARTDCRRLGPDWLLTLVPEAAAWWDPETADV
jgi:diaminohydroxyphosphoribosylaminopyrimidine deaminase/5-amino-6-(5-phosphoribosylamino)uracil reductase